MERKQVFEWQFSGFYLRWALLSTIIGLLTKKIQIFTSDCFLKTSSFFQEYPKKVLRLKICLKTPNWMKKLITSRVLRVSFFSPPNSNGVETNNFYSKLLLMEKFNPWPPHWGIIEKRMCYCISLLLHFSFLQLLKVHFANLGLN